MGRLTILWTKDEIEYLKREYSKTDTEEVVRTLGRNRNAVMIKAHALGLKKDNRIVAEIRSKAQTEVLARKRQEDKPGTSPADAGLSERIMEIDRRLDAMPPLHEMEELIRKRSSLLFKLDKSVGMGVSSLSVTQWANSR